MLKYKCKSSDKEKYGDKLKCNDRQVFRKAKIKIKNKKSSFLRQKINLIKWTRGDNLESFFDLIDYAQKNNLFGRLY